MAISVKRCLPFSCFIYSFSRIKTGKSGQNPKITGQNFLHYLLHRANVKFFMRKTGPRAPKFIQGRVNISFKSSVRAEKLAESIRKSGSG